MNDQASLFGLAWEIRDTLEFYANPDSYRPVLDPGHGQACKVAPWKPARPVLRDRGHRARQAIETIQGSNLFASNEIDWEAVVG